MTAIDAIDPADLPEPCTRSRTASFHCARQISRTTHSESPAGGTSRHRFCSALRFGGGSRRGRDRRVRDRHPRRRRSRSDAHHLVVHRLVGSTDRVAAIGDRAWHTLLDRHDDVVGRQLARFSGHQEKFTGDGILATFDGPARAIRCGIAIRDAARQIGLDVRVGIHTGEVERRGTELAGIAVHLAHRICQPAQPGEVLVSRTVVDLVAGSGATFDDRGEHELKGIPAAWRLFAATS